MTTPHARIKIPVLFLKTESTPADFYREVFAAAASDNPCGRRFVPRFVPVLQHKSEEPGMSNVRSIFREKRIGPGEEREFGGLIFTSQRAVEAFSNILAELSKEDLDHLKLHDIPIYCVGPATKRALTSIPHDPPLQILGESTGEGSALARYILTHYGDWYSSRQSRPPLLFLVGEQRRDVIPKTLMSETLDEGDRITVREEVVYSTGVMESFPDDFAQALEESKECVLKWVVVFSPTGCNHMLRGLGLIDENDNPIETTPREGKTLIATIGPTTRGFLQDNFGAEPDVCAPKPTPEALLQEIQGFEKHYGLLPI